MRLHAVAMLGLVAPWVLPARAAGDEPSRVISPTFGRPAIVAPGEVLEVVACSVRVVERIELSDERYARRVTAPRESASASQPAVKDVAALRFRIPADAAEGTYDLVLEGAGVSERRCVAVRHPTQHLRFVHLSDMNIGDLGAPQVDPRLIDEINLFAPSAVLCTGDLVDAASSDPQRDWSRVVDALSRIDAPLILARGDHDDARTYADRIAPSPVGVVSVPPARVVVLCDHAGSELARDDEQVRWLEATLADRRAVAPTIVLAHEERPNWLALLRSRGVLATAVRQGQVAAAVCGGRRDWDGVEYAALARDAFPALLIRTAAASGAMRDGASGTPHYRVFEIRGDVVTILADDAPGRAAPGSMAVGGIECAIERRDARTVELSAINRHPFALCELRAVVDLPADAGEPWARGAAISRAEKTARGWRCDVRFDLPQQGVLRALVGVGEAPRAPAVRIRYDGPPRVELRRTESRDGVRYLDGGHVRAAFVVDNTDPAAALCVTPQVRLAGDRLAYAVDDGPAAGASRLVLPPGASAVLRVDMSAIRVEAGRRELQLYLEGLPTLTAFVAPLMVRVVDEPRAAAAGRD